LLLKRSRTSIFLDKKLSRRLKRPQRNKTTDSMTLSTKAHGKKGLGSSDTGKNLTKSSLRDLERRQKTTAVTTSKDPMDSNPSESEKASYLLDLQSSLLQMTICLKILKISNHSPHTSKV
jgi:hypothetical protein